MKYISLFFYILFLSSCSIKLNSSKNESKDFKTDFAVVKYNETSLFQKNQFVEINARNILTIAKKNEKTLFYLLAPWCSPCIKKFPFNYKYLDSLSIKKKIPFYVLNNSYGFERTIEKIYKKVNLQSPIYVFDNAIYNGDIDVNTSTFLHEICDSCTSNSNGWILLIDKKLKIFYFSNDINNVTKISNAFDNNW